MDKLQLNRPRRLMFFKFICNVRILLVFSLLLFNASTSDIANKTRKFEAESAQLIGGTSKVADREASGGFLVSLTKPDNGIRFTGLPASGKLAIRYSSLGVGLIGVSVNNEPVQKLNIHSSGNLTGSFLNAIIYITVPKNANLTVTLVTDSITVNIDQIIVGDGNLGLPPDIWNLPPLTVPTGMN
jgi:hypothetical protein